MFRVPIIYTLIGLILGQFSLAIAETQVSTGDHSPNTIINTPLFQLIDQRQYNYPPPLPSPPVTSKGLRKELDKRNDKLSNEIAKLLENGNSVKALKKINNAVQHLSPEVESTAFLHYIRGGIYLVQQKYILAELALRSANASDPSNCKYRGLYALTLIYLDRYAEASRVVGEDVIEAFDCLRNGDVLDLSRILLAQTYIAIEDRDETTTIRLIHAFESAISPLSVSKSPEAIPEEGAILACTMKSAIQATWSHDSSMQDKFGTSDLCTKFSESPRKNNISIDSMVSAGALTNARLNLMTPLDEVDRGGPSINIKDISAKIAIVESAPNVHEFGFDEHQKSFVLGRLFYLRGLSQLKLLNLKESIADLTHSFKKIEPLASLKHPEAFTIYVQLVLIDRVLTYSLNPLLKLSSSDTDLETRESRKWVRRIIGEVAHAKAYDKTPRTCRAILMVSEFASRESMLHELKVDSANKNANKSKPSPESSSQQSDAVQASLVSKEDHKIIKDKLVDCMKKGLGRNSLLYGEFLISMAELATVDSMVEFISLDENDSDVVRKFAQTFEEKLTQNIAIMDSYRGFPKYYEKRQTYQRKLFRRATMRELQGKYDDATSDLEKVVDLQKRFGSKHDLMQALARLSFHIMRYANEPAVAASLAQQAFTNGIEYISGEPRSCLIVSSVFKTGNMAARRWLNAGQWDKAVTSMQQIVEISEANGANCLNSGLPKLDNDVSLIFSEFTQDAKQALEVMGKNSSSYLGEDLPIDLELIKKYESDWRDFRLVVPDKQANSKADSVYPLILELKDIADARAASKTKL